MAILKVRGNTHNVIYTYKDQNGKQKQHWESYTTELEAIQRKAYIDYLQKNKRYKEVSDAVAEYRRKRDEEKIREILSSQNIDCGSRSEEDNLKKTYGEFVEKWLPFHARKERLSPNSYDCYRGIIENHILPYFGCWRMSTITAEDIDNFIDYLSTKPCRGPKSYNKNPGEIPTLGSATVKKCYSILMSGFPVARKWKYITEIPQTKAPAEKTKKRKAWDSKKVYEASEGIKDDKLLHLAVHLAFVCSLRAGETAGIDMRRIDFMDRSFWITQEIQRVSDEALSVIPKTEIIRVFPKIKESSKSSLILKSPKTEGSTRKQYLTTPLLQEIRDRIQQIEKNKAFFGNEYQDYGLLICHPDGKPIEPKSLNKSFKRWQAQQCIEDQIEFQGLRKSGQMHKVRLSQNNYQLVAENSGQSPEVLMSNYNEALESEKRSLSQLVESNYYPSSNTSSDSNTEDDAADLIRRITRNPEIISAILRSMQKDVAKAL